jgi:hypothetical protein
VIARLVAVAAGVWLMFAPAVLGYTGVAENNDRTFGPIGASIAFVAIWEVVRALRWGTLPVGIWLAVAPLVLRYDDVAAVLSSVVAGLVMAGSTFFGGHVDASFGGGWRAVSPARWRMGPDEGSGREIGPGEVCSR